MTGKEYKICASDSPSTLASEVTELLSQGWELYGPPFVGRQNGHTESGPAICQAMVKGSEQPATSPVRPFSNGTVVAPRPKASRPEPQIVRPKRPAIAATARNVAIFMALAFCGAFLADCLVFRSGFYGLFLSPLSSTGTFERIFYAEANRPPSGKKEVLVMGNSRIAEGFSAKIANEYKNDGFWFSNCAVPASSARDFYYFIRDIDPHRDRYAAIAIPIDDYNDIDSTDDPADRLSEMWLVINRLRLTDIVPYTLSFKSPEARFQAARGSTLKGLVFQRDAQDFIENTTNRLKSVSDYRQHGSDWLYAYGGASPSLAGMSVDWASHKVTFPPGMPQDQQNELARQIFLAPPQHGWMHDYQKHWLSALADLYRGSRTRIVIYQLPRSAAPRPTPLVHWKSTAVDEICKFPWVKVVDHSVFETLEKPELFFDFIHLNTAGRKVFSPLLADTVKASLQ